MFTFVIIVDNRPPSIAVMKTESVNVSSPRNDKDSDGYAVIFMLTKTTHCLHRWQTNLRPITHQIRMHIYYDIYTMCISNSSQVHTFFLDYELYKCS